MKSLFQYLRKSFNNSPFLIITFFLLVFGGPTLFVGWALVDDGKSAQVASDISVYLGQLNMQGFLQSLLEYDSGRFRPGYWLYLWITFLLTGSSAFLHHGLHFGVLALSAFFIYQFGKKLGSHVLVGILAVIFFVTDWQILENWYRLGPQEPISIPFFLSSLWFFLKSRESQKKRYLLFSILTLLAAYFIKETNIAYIGIPLYLLSADLVLRKKGRILFYDSFYLLGSILGALLVRLLPLSIYSGGDYANNYQLNLFSIKINFLSYLDILTTGYSPLLEIVVISLLIRVFMTFRSKGFCQTVEKFYWPGLFLSWFLSFLLIQLPWGFSIGRYLQITYVGFVLVMAYEIVNLYLTLRSYGEMPSLKKRYDLILLLRISNFILLGSILVVMFYQMFMSLIYIQYVTLVTNFNERIVKEVSVLAPQQGRAFLNVESEKQPHLELFMEIGWHLKYVFGRPDIHYDYIPTASYSPENGDLILNNSVPVVIPRTVFENDPRYLLKSRFSVDPSFVILTSPVNLMRNSVILLGDALIGREIKIDKLFVISGSHYQWEVYQYHE